MNISKQLYTGLALILLLFSSTTDAMLRSARSGARIAAAAGVRAGARGSVRNVATVAAGAAGAADSQGVWFTAEQKLACAGLAGLAAGGAALAYVDHVEHVPSKYDEVDHALASRLVEKCKKDEKPILPNFGVRHFVPDDFIASAYLAMFIDKNMVPEGHLKDELDALFRKEGIVWNVTLGKRLISDKDDFKYVQDYFIKPGAIIYLLSRVVSAAHIDGFAKKHKLQHIIVPKKYFYKDPVHNILYVIEEKVDFVEQRDEITDEHIKEVKLIVADLKLWDLHNGNFIFTKEGKLAFIDLEYSCLSSCLGPGRSWIERTPRSNQKKLALLLREQIKLFGESYAY